MYKSLQFLCASPLKSWPIPFQAFQIRQRISGFEQFGRWFTGFWRLGGFVLFFPCIGRGWFSPSSPHGHVEGVIAHFEPLRFESLPNVLQCLPGLEGCLYFREKRANEYGFPSWRLGSQAFQTAAVVFLR